MKISDRDIRFVARAAGAALLVMIFLHLINPLIQPPDPQASEIEQAAHAIVSIRASDVPPLLRDAKGKPTLTFIYASWCGYCRQMMPDVIELLRDGSFDHLNVRFLSIDGDFTALARYLVKNGYYSLFTPYAVKGSAVNPLEKAMTSIGSSYSGTLPYVAVFDAAGWPLAEAKTAIDRQKLLDMAASAR